MATIIIVGAGLGGLSCAARVAARGHRVTVLEQGQSVGGCTSAVTWNGHVFDGGATTLTLPGAYRDLFAKTGRPLEDVVDLVALDEAGRYHYPDGTVLRLPGVGVGRTTAAVHEALGARAAAQWRDYVAAAAREWARVRPRLTERPRRRRSRLAAVVSDPRVSLLIQRRCAGWGALSGGGHSALLPYLEATFGVHHIAGGVHQLALAVYQRCAELGVGFRFGIDVGPGSLPAADVVVWAHASDIRADVARQQHIALAAPVADVGHHTEWLTPTGAWVTAWVPADDRMHPPGTQSWTVRTNHPSTEPVAALAAHGVDLRSHAAWISEPVTLPATNGASPQRLPRRRPRHHFVVGAATHPGPGLPMVAMSAERVAAVIGRP